MILSAKGILTAKKRNVGSECSLYGSKELIVSDLAMAKWSKSSPSSFLIRRKRDKTALHGPHHAEYTSTTEEEVVENCILLYIHVHVQYVNFVNSNQ